MKTDYDCNLRQLELMVLQSDESSRRSRQGIRGRRGRGGEMPRKRNFIYREAGGVVALNDSCQ